MRSYLLASLTALAILAPHAAAQTTWYVDVTNSSPGSGTQADPYASIQFAIDAGTTLAGDTLSVALGEYFENIDYAGKAITIHGEGGAQAGEYPVLRPAMGTGLVFASGEGPSSVLRHMRIRGGTGSLVNGVLMGGSVLIRGASPTFQDVIIRNGSARQGGGVAIIENSAPAFEQVQVRRCDALVGAGVLVQDSSLDWTGGGLWGNENPDYAPSEAFGNGLAAFSSSASLQSLTFTGNGLQGASGRGGGIYCDPTASVQVTDSTFRQQRARFGAAGYGPAEYTRCLFEANRADTSGGAIYGGSAVDCVFRSNRSYERGGAASWSQLTGCLLEYNTNSFWVIIGPGGAAFMSDLVDCIVQFNSARVGGGIYGGSALRTTFKENSAIAGVGRGGAAALADLDRCEFFGNVAIRGSAVWLGSAPAGYPSAGPGRASHCTFHRNPTRSTSSGIYNETIFLGATAGPVTHCIIEFSRKADITAPMGGDVTWSCLSKPFPGLGNFVASPKLAGFVTYDAHLLPSSPCIDAGDPTAPPDPDGSVADVGAHVFDPAYTRGPALLCTQTLHTSCQSSITTNITGQLSGTGVGGAVMHLDGLEFVTLGYLLLSLQPQFATLDSNSNLCIGNPRRVGTLGVSQASSNCTGTLDLQLPSAEVSGMAGVLVYVQSVINQGSQWQGLDAYELLVGQ